MKKMGNLVGSVLLLVLFALPAFSQSEPGDFLGSGGNCEMQIYVVERIMRLSKERDERVFIISRQAAKERRSIGWSRLRYTRDIMTKFRRFPADKVTISAGENSAGPEGYLKFWVGSRLELELYVPRNRQICLMSPTQSE
jgi:hypothetical protein